MRTFCVKFSYNGDDKLESQVRKFITATPGGAAKRCLRRYPGVKVVALWIEGGFGSEYYGRINYDVPSTVSIKAAPAPKVEEPTFAFFDQCLSYQSRKDFRSESKTQH
jgi:hypothetical protein